MALRNLTPAHRGSELSLVSVEFFDGAQSGWEINAPIGEGAFRTTKCL